MNDKKDRQVQKTASLHERAVQAVASGEVGPVPTKTRKRPEKRSEPVHTHIVVDPRVMSVVREIIDNPEKSYTKVEIIDEGTVLLR